MRVGVLLLGERGPATAQFTSAAQHLGWRHLTGTALCDLPSAAAELDAVVVQRAARGYSADDWAELVSPLELDTADVVVGQRATRSLADRLTDELATLALGTTAFDSRSGVMALRVATLGQLTLSPTDATAELLTKLANRSFRFRSVPLANATRTAPSESLAGLGTFLRQLTGGADVVHEGHATLANLEGAAVNYNAWLGAQFEAFSGRRVLEIGAGLGTITAHLATHAEKVIALELEPAYVERLHNRFRGQTTVEPRLTSVADADWSALERERLDTVVMSNVLEHIEDDVGVLARCRALLPAGGRVLLYVPALEQLFGSLDREVGHFRRYTPRTLSRALSAAGLEVERLEWRNALGIPGWFLNARVLRRRVLPPFQLKLYDLLTPTVAELERRVRLPVGSNLFCVAKRPA